MVEQRGIRLAIQPARRRGLHIARGLAPTDVVACGRLMVNTGVILVTSSPAFAHHDTVGGGTAIGGGSLIGTVLPIVVVVVLVMVGVAIWGRKKRKTKSKRRKRRN